MSPQDAAELERTTREQTMLQKQLDQLRKQNNQHQSIIQEFQKKKVGMYSTPHVFRSCTLSLLVNIFSLVVQCDGKNVSLEWPRS